MVRSIDPRRETLRAIQWQSSKPPYCLELMSRNPSWQRSCATASTDRTYDRKRSGRALPNLLQAGGRPHMDARFRGHDESGRFHLVARRDRPACNHLAVNPAIRVAEVLHQRIGDCEIADAGV